MNKLTKYFKGVNREAHRVRWPMKQFLLRNVMIVFSVTIICSLAIFLLDFFTAELMRSLNEAFKNSSSSSTSADSSQVAMLFNYIECLVNSII